MAADTQRWLTESLLELLAAVAGRADQAALHRTLVQQSAALFGEDVVVCTFTVDRRRQLRLVAASHGVTDRSAIEEAVSEPSPCRESVERGTRVEADLTRPEVVRRWHQFTGAARDAGVVSAAAFPIRSGGRTVGVLGIGDRTTRTLPRLEVDTVQRLLDTTGPLFRQQQTVQDLAELTRQLQRALGSRVVIEQAKGMLAEQLGVDTDTAFETLRAYARTHNRRLRDVAWEITTRTLTGEALSEGPNGPVSP